MISILIPVYNTSILTLVETLLKQIQNSGKTFEIICLDDGSTNKKTIETNQQIRSFQNCEIYTNPTNLGRTKTRQILAQKAKFNWLLFLDSDVLPKDDDFVSKYLNSNYSDFDCVCGGISYNEKSKSEATMLRWKVGKEREEKLAVFRMTNPYNFLLSGNMLIKKEVFLALNFTENANLYGMDVYFGYQLFRNQKRIQHIDNAVIHLGLETNTVYFAKTLEAVKNRKHYLVYEPEIEKVNSLLKKYKTLKKLGLTSICSVLFLISKPVLKFFIFQKNPNLFCYDLYRLGYICSINQ